MWQSLEWQNNNEYLLEANPHLNQWLKVGLLLAMMKLLYTSTAIFFTSDNPLRTAGINRINTVAMASGTI